MTTTHAVRLPAAVDPEAVRAALGRITAAIQPVVEAFRRLARRFVRAFRTWWPRLRRMLGQLQPPPARALRLERRAERRRLRRMVPAHHRR